MTSKETVARVAEMVAKDSRKNWSWIKHGGFGLSLLSAICVFAAAHGKSQQKALDTCKVVKRNVDKIEVVEKELNSTKTSIARIEDGVSRIEAGMEKQSKYYREDMKDLREEMTSIREKVNLR